MVFNRFERVTVLLSPRLCRGMSAYVVDGKMIGRFALIAYPARYGSSGIMTLSLIRMGVVYEKNLGKNTEKTAEAMVSFDPDQTWKKVE